jgi:hypothetical protein
MKVGEAVSAERQWRLIVTGIEVRAEHAVSEAVNAQRRLAVPKGHPFLNRSQQRAENQAVPTNKFWSEKLTHSAGPRGGNRFGPTLSLRVLRALLLNFQSPVSERPVRRTERKRGRPFPTGNRGNEEGRQKNFFVSFVSVY